MMNLIHFLFYLSNALFQDRNHFNIYEFETKFTRNLTYLFTTQLDTTQKLLHILCGQHTTLYSCHSLACSSTLHGGYLCHLRMAPIWGRGVTPYIYRLCGSYVVSMCPPSTRFYNSRVFSVFILSYKYLSLEYSTFHHEA